MGIHNFTMSGTPLPSSFDGNADFYEENRWQKFSRRLKEEPLIPLGCALTCWALYNASRSIRAGDSNRTNRMFRARIYAQGFTLLAMIGGSMYWQTDRQKRKEYDVVIAEKKAKEKNQASLGADGKEKVAADAGEKQGIFEKVVEEGKGASSVVGEEEKRKGVLESVSSLVWGKK